MISVDGENRKIGLALSGGGFRASIFHMGVLRRLAEFNLLDKIDVLSTVSGGSIVGAFYALNRNLWGDIERLENRFLQGVQADIRFRALTGAWLFHPFLFLRSIGPGFSRTNIIAREYARFFFGGATLKDLPALPRLIINATSLNTGVIWKFSRDKVGDYKSRFRKIEGFPVSLAVAASSAVPGLFPPLVLRETKPADTGKRISLSDGGVRDNQGLTSIFSEKCDYVISSDASGLIATLPRPSKFSYRVLLRANSITMNASRALLIQSLFRRKETAEIRQFVFFDMKDTVTSEGPKLPKQLIRAAASVRTDLDHFSDAEIATIRYHGYTLIDQKLKKHAPDLLQGADPPLTYTEPFPDDRIAAFSKALERSHKRRLLPRNPLRLFFPNRCGRC